jgi:predicted nucleic acid-binding protein
MELVIGGRNPGELGIIRKFLDLFRILTIDDRVSRFAMSFVEQYSMSYGMEIPDALIAATAVRYGWPLYTRNLRHYRMIQGLMPIGPY